MSGKNPIDDLIAVMARLRDPDGGCPWDLQQDFRSIAPYTIEEAYEVADAIDRDDMVDLREELGDLLFQSVYHAQMAAEAGHFDLYDVIRDVTAKMVSRHPHVFGDEQARDASDVNAIWDRQKSGEKDTKSDAPISALDGVPQAFPSLLRAQKLQKKAGKTGFEWTDVRDVLDKLEEELGEMREAAESGSEREKEEELGDILFVLANYARLNGINAEEALRKCCNKFEFRFKGMEEDFKKSDLKSIENASLDQMTQMWNAQKKKTV